MISVYFFYISFTFFLTLLLLLFIFQTSLTSSRSKFSFIVFKSFVIWSPPADQKTRILECQWAKKKSYFSFKIKTKYGSEFPFSFCNTSRIMPFFLREGQADASVVHVEKMQSYTYRFKNLSRTTMALSPSCVSATLGDFE